MTVATLGMAGQGCRILSRATGIADILCKGEEKKEIKDDSGSSILTTC